MSKHCPKCNGTLFKAVIKRPGIVDLSGDELVIKVEVNTKDSTKYEVVECYNKECAIKLTNEDLVSTVKCEKCQKLVSSEDLINGICLDCFLEVNPEYKKLSMTQLIKKVIELQAQPEAQSINEAKKVNKEEPKEITKDDKQDDKQDDKKDKVEKVERKRKPRTEVIPDETKPKVEVKEEVKPAPAPESKEDKKDVVNEPKEEEVVINSDITPPVFNDDDPF